MKSLKTIAGIAAILGIAGPALAHVSLENKEVAPGATVKFVLRLPHGCSGSATTSLRIAVPEQLSSVKPQPKPGWNLSVTTEDLHKISAETTHAHGGAAQVKEISWTGGKLDDAFYDEFVFRATVSKTATDRIFVPIVQECESGVDRWIEIPAAGASADDLKHPAPSVRIQP